MKEIGLRFDVRNILVSFFEKYLNSEMIVFDVGCGTKPFSNYLSKKVKRHIGVDIENGFYDCSHIDLFGTAYHVPVEADAADAVISSQVLEHLEHPDKAVEEAARILNDGGLFFITVPFLYPIHAEPYDFSRLTIFKLEHLLDKNGFQIIEKESTGGLWYLFGVYIGIYLGPFDRGFLKKTRLLTLLLWSVKIFFMRFLHGLEGFFIKLFQKDPKVFRKKWTMNYTIVARKTNM